MQCAPIVTFAWKSSLASHFPTIQTFTSQPVSGSRLPLTRRTSTPSSSTGSQARAKFELFMDWVSRNIETCRYFGPGQREWANQRKLKLFESPELNKWTGHTRLQRTWLCITLLIFIVNFVCRLCSVKVWVIFLFAGNQPPSLFGWRQYDVVKFICNPREIGAVDMFREERHTKWVEGI